jgi:hypothetical protein
LVVMMLYLGWNGVGLPIAFLPGSTWDMAHFEN